MKWLNFFFFFSAQICASLMDGSHLFFPFDSIFIPLYLFFSKRWIYVNSKSETTDVWCDVLVPSLCAICWHGVPHLKYMLVPGGEQTHFVVVPLLKQADGKRTIRKSLEATRMGPFPFCHDVWEGNPNNESTWQRGSWRARDAVVLLSGKCLWLYSLFRKRRLNILDVQPCYAIAAMEMGDL